MQKKPKNNWYLILPGMPHSVNKEQVVPNVISTNNYIEKASLHNYQPHYKIILF